MAITAMSTMTRKILQETAPIPSGIVTCNTGALTTIFPGMIVSITGGATHTRLITIPVANDTSFGVVLLEPGWDIDVAYPAYKAVNVAKRGSGCIVAIWLQAAQEDIKAGLPLNNSGVSADGFAIYGEAIDEYIGLAYRDSDGHATNDTPALIQLV